jgi:hypothetical protein
LVPEVAHLEEALAVRVLLLLGNLDLGQVDVDAIVEVPVLLFDGVGVVGVRQGDLKGTVPMMPRPVSPTVCPRYHYAVRQLAHHTPEVRAGGTKATNHAAFDATPIYKEESVWRFHVQLTVKQNGLAPGPSRTWS